MIKGYDEPRSTRGEPTQGTGGVVARLSDRAPAREVGWLSGRVRVYVSVLGCCRLIDGIFPAIILRRAAASAP